MPIDIFPVQLIKAILKKTIDGELRIYEVDPKTLLCVSIHVHPKFGTVNRMKGLDIIQKEFS